MGFMAELLCWIVFDCTGVPNEVAGKCMYIYCIYLYVFFTKQKINVITPIH